MNMDLAYKVMGWCVLAFALTMFGLGHVMTGNGGDGLDAMDAQRYCENSGAVGVNIIDARGGTKTHLCR